MTRLITILSAFVLAALLGTLFVLTSLKPANDLFAKCRQSRVAGGAAAIGGPFTLVSETGETVTDADVITEPSLLYFGYTFCPDVCPADTARIAEATDVLDGLGYRVQPVFISIDPERDSPEVLADYTSYLHDRMLGLTGSAEQTRAVAQAYRAYYQKQPSDDEFYLMDHSAFTYLVLPDYGFVEVFGRSLEAEELASRVACFVAAAETI